VAGAHGPAAGVGVLGTGGKVGGVDGPICSPGIEDPTPAGEDPTPAGEDPTPATVAGKPEKLPGVLGLVPRCVAVIDDPFSGQGTPVSGRRRPVSGHLLRAACQAGGRAGAASPRRVRGSHLPSPCRGAASPARPPAWQAARRRWPLPELASWRPG